jgi:hypothetical protein
MLIDIFLYKYKPSYIKEVPMLNFIIAPIKDFLNKKIKSAPLEITQQDSSAVLSNDKTDALQITQSEAINTQVNPIESPPSIREKTFSMENPEKIATLVLKSSKSSVDKSDLSKETNVTNAKAEDLEPINTSSSTRVNSAEPAPCPRRILRLVLKKTELKELFEKYVDDPRHGKCTYLLSSLLLMGTLIPLLRCPSRHAFHDQTQLSHLFSENSSKLAETNSVPCAKTFEDCFMQLDSSGLEEVLPALFERLLRKKFFQLHPEFRGGLNSKDPSFLVGIDAHVIHHYTAKSQHPCKHCPYCLKRTTENATWYLHCNVILSIIGDHGFQMPLFQHRIRSQQKLETCSKEKFKQECELTALPLLLQKFRLKFPRLSATLLLDSLYANGTAMGLAEKFHFDYSIVRKEGSLPSLNAEMIHLKKWVSFKSQTVASGQWEKEQEASIFRDFTHQGHPFTLIDFKERCQRAASSRFAKIREKTIHWQWITTKKFKNSAVFKVTKQARLRWRQEDFFNTLQHRGFSILHDFSRNFKSQNVWQLLSLIAFTLSTLMELSRLGRLSRRSASILNWIKYLFALLVAGSLEWWNYPLPEQLRFDSS